MPIHFAILRMAGWHLARGESTIITDEAERVEAMRSARAELIQVTKQDYGFDIAQWREFLMAFKEFGYLHPYAFQFVDKAILEAVQDPVYARFVELAERNNC